MDIYNGNSVPITINANYKDGSQYVFKVGDIVKLGIKKYIGAIDYIYEESKTVSETTSSVDFNIPPANTEDLLGNYVIEAELTYNNGEDVSTLFQEEFIVKGVVIDE